jgi:hypothetical protein
LAWLALGGDVSELSEKRAESLRTIALRRRTTLGGRRVRATDAQRARVAGRGCLVCGRRPVDPAHLVPQRFGGCAEAECVVPLCRAHHRIFDRGRLALAPFLDGAEFGAELAHARGHVGERRLRAALEGCGWPPPWNESDREVGR